VQNSGVVRRENAESCSSVIASAAKQSSFLKLRRKLDCFVASLLAMTVEGCLKLRDCDAVISSVSPLWEKESKSRGYSARTGYSFMAGSAPSIPTTLP
jgi:hypothetical protein